MENVQIFLFPFAGGNAYSFNKLINRLPKNMEMTVLEYPGHGTRSKEPFIDDFELILNDVAKQINTMVVENVKVVFFGYSLGSLIAFETIARHMIHADVFCLFACAQESPTINSFSKSNIEWTEENVLKYTIKLGGIDQRLKANPRLLKALLLPTKHDYIVRESYVYSNGMITCPVHVLYSDEDTSYWTVEKWKECCKNEVSLHSFKGNHFFINDNVDAIADILIKEINILTCEGENTMNNLERYTRIFMETFDVSKDEAISARFHEIAGWDSVGQMSLITALEEEFNIYFEPEDIILVTSFEDGKEVLKKYDVEL